jgi:hypothetical protein
MQFEMTIQKASVSRWNTEDVGKWLFENDFDEYVELFSMHKIDGSVLLRITESDLREPPMTLTCLGDIKRIGIALEKLRTSNDEISVMRRPPSQSTLPPVAVQHRDADANGFALNPHDPRTTASAPAIIPRRSSNSAFLISRVESPDTELKSLLKTFLAIGYCCFSLLLTSFVMVIVHDRVPDMKTYPPLPDIFLDNVPLISWAFEVCELLACVLCAILTLVVIFHKHRLILLRRMFSLTGTVFSLRCITMMITSLSVPGVHLECTNRSYDDIYAKIRQAFRIWYGMGMSIRGVRTCGDYMFSGHTTVVTLLNHFITEYTPDDWHNLHTASWVMNLFSIFFILAGHEHYSIDVFVAFYISSRLFLYYHSMAYHANSLTYADARTRSWFPLFWFFESGGHLGRIPNEFGIPFGEDIKRWWKNRAIKQLELIDETNGIDELPTGKVKFQLGSNDLVRNGHHKNGGTKKSPSQNGFGDHRSSNKKKTKNN